MPLIPKHVLGGGGMTTLTPTQRLKLIDHVLASDGAFEAQSLDGDYKTKREQIFADIITRLYRIAHPATAPCTHPTWEEESVREYEELIKKRR